MVMEMESMKLGELVNLLNSNSTIQAKKDVYAQIHTLLHKEINVFNFNENLLPIIQRHLKQNKFVNEALTTWILYAQLSKTLPGELVKAIYHHKSNFDQLMPLFCDFLNENLLDMDQVLSPDDVTLNKHILNSLGNISDNVPFRLYLNFINDKVLKVIFSTRNDETRNILIDFVLMKKSTFCISFCSSEEQKQITNLVKNKYIRLIDDLRKESNNNWYNLCMFTMKYCGKLLHSEIEIMNMILHNVEVGFKTKTVQDRLLSYECWKVLIDTCNLDHNYVCSIKQLRLLVKPLKVKLSKNEGVVQKRFEVWFYLANILQEKILYCLEDFLKFCFELQGENCISEMCITSDIIKNTYILRNEALSAIIGHYGHDGTCIPACNFNFTIPIVNSTNFPQFDTLLVNSVYVMCKSISKWDNDSKIMRVKCIWGSIFKIIQRLNETSKEYALHRVSKIIQCLLQDSVVNKNYFNDIMVPIFSLLSSFQEPICNALLLNEILIFPVIRFMLSQDQIEPLWAREVTALVHDVPKTGNKLFYFNRICELLKTSPRTNSTFPIHFWLRLAEDLYDICRMPRESFNDYREDALFFLMWIFSCHNMEVMSEPVVCMWKKIFSEVCIISNTFGEDLLGNCTKLLGKSPECASNLLMVLPDMSQIMLHSKYFKRYVTQLLNITFLCLQNPCVPKKRVIMTIPIIRKGLCICMSGDGIETYGFISKIYECMEYLLRPHQVFEILGVFKEIFPKLNSNLKRKVPSSLKDVFSDLARNSDVLVSQDARFILEQLMTEDNNKIEPHLFVRPSVSSRSARIADMAKSNELQSSPKGSILKTILQNKDVTQALENNASTIPAVKKNTTRTKATPPRKHNGICNIDEDSAEFVLVNKEVKIDKSKLSDHQKEIMHKRREDIPALYQDLSQSQHSNSTETNNSCSGTQNKLNLTIDDNFKDIITDLRKKTDTLHENFDAELNPLFESNEAKTDPGGAKKCDTDNDGSKNCSSNSDLGLKFEKNMESKKIVEVNTDCTKGINDESQEQSCENKSAEETPNRDKPVFCSSKFEENDEKMEAAQAPIFPDHDLDNLSVASERSIKKKHKSQIPKSKLVRNRRMSDSNIVLQKAALDLCTLTDDDDNYLNENDELSNGPVTLDKHIKIKNKEFKSAIREKRKKHVSSNRHCKTCQLGEQTCKSTEDLCNSQGILKFKKKYRSLDNLSDIEQKMEMRKGKKCFKIIPNDIDLNNSIKLRISITEEDNDTGQDIIEQLDTEISKIDANLQNNCRFLNKNSPNNNSESIFGSLDLMDNLEESMGWSCRASDTVKNQIGTSVAASTSDNVEIRTSEESRREPHITPTLENNKKDLSTQRRKRRELDRIKMDIVGADEFLVTTPRKRRTPKPLESKSEIPTTNKQSNEPSFPSKSPKKTNRLHEEKLDNKTTKISKTIQTLTDASLKNNVATKHRRENAFTNSPSKLNETSARKRRSSKKQSAENEEVALTNDSDVQYTDKQTYSRDDTFPNEEKKSTKKKTNMRNGKRQSAKKPDGSLEEHSQTKPNVKNLNKINDRFCAKREKGPSKRKLRVECSQLQLTLTPIKITSGKQNLEEVLVLTSPNNAVAAETPAEDTAIQMEIMENSSTIQEGNKGVIKSECIEQDTEIHEHTTRVVGNNDSLELQRNDICKAIENIKDKQENVPEIICESREADSKLSDTDSYNFIFEINGLAINNSAASDAICESYSTTSNTGNADGKTISLHLGTSENRVEEAGTDVKLILADDTQDCVNNTTNSSNVKGENVENKYVPKTYVDSNEENAPDDNETQSCDPYVDIQNDQDVMEKMDKYCPGAVRTIIKDLSFNSLPLLFDTPKKGSIPCSPVCDDTPDRNKEFLNDTSDISPIKVELMDAEVLQEAKPLVNEEACIKKVSSRSAKLLNLVPNSGGIVPAKMAKRSVETVRAEVSTPPTQRIRKMISNCDKLQTPKKKQVVDGACDSSRSHNVLVFARELPSPLATPNSSILKKRKFTELENSVSPYSKRRKRVNFSDPPTTSQKIYFVESEENSENIETCQLSFSSELKLVKEDSIYPKLTSCLIDIKDVVDLLNQDLVKQFHSVNIRTVGDLAELNNNQVNSLDFLGESRVHRITEVLDTIYSNYLKKQNTLREKTSLSIYPDLINCGDPIRNILKFVGNCHTAKEFRSNNITTIGDLATLTNVEASQLSFKLPTILNALQKYRRKLNKSKILAKQKEEEMKDEFESESINVFNATNSVVAPDGENFEESTCKEYIQAAEEFSTTTDFTNKSECSKRTVEEEVNYMKNMYDRDELSAIFYHLKDILFADK